MHEQTHHTPGFEGGLWRQLSVAASQFQCDCWMQLHGEPRCQTTCKRRGKHNSALHKEQFNFHTSNSYHHESIDSRNSNANHFSGPSCKTSFYTHMDTQKPQSTAFPVSHQENLNPIVRPSNSDQPGSFPHQDEHY